MRKLEKLRPPVTSVVIACDTSIGARTYEVFRSEHNVYRGPWGLMLTKKKAGPNGEPIIDRVRFSVSRIAEFRDWQEVKAWLRSLRPTNIETLYAEDV